MKVYGYCRISTFKQSMERQIRNIKLAYPDAVIVKETYTGTKIQGRKEFEKLIKIVSAGDTTCNSCHFPSFRAKPIEKQMDFYIMILTNEGKNQTGKGQDYAEYILNYCVDRKIFPLVQIYQDQEKFFGEMQKTIPSIVLLALQGVAGLNAAEHLRSLHPLSQFSKKGGTFSERF